MKPPRSHHRGTVCRILPALIFGVTPGTQAQFEDANPPVAVSVEWIALEKTDAFKLLAEHEEKPDATDLREAIEKRLDTGKARLVESLYCRSQPGDEAQSGSAEEFQFGTEGDPPEIPSELDLRNVDPGDFRGTPGAFVAFETRNVGPSLTWEASLRDGKIALDLSAELVTRLFDDFFARHPKMHPHNEMQDKSFPRFVSLRIDNKYRLESGEVVLAASLKPIRYRREISDEEGENADPDSQRVLVFLTAWVLR